MVTPCRFARWGCGESVTDTDKLMSHEESCTHARVYDCPMDGCGHRGPELYEHVRDEHAPAANYDDPDSAAGVAIISHVRATSVALRKDAPFLVLLQPGRGRVFVLLNDGDLKPGKRLLALVCLGPRHDEEDYVKLEYSLEVNATGEGLFPETMSGTVPCARRLEGFKPGCGLLLPNGYWSAAGTLSVKVRVTAPPAPSHSLLLMSRRHRRHRLGLV